MRIRRATIQDLPRILAIEQSSFGRDAWDASLFRTYLQACPKLFVVAIRGTAIAGYAIACIRRRQGEIESIAVHPRSLRRGVGTVLMRFVLGAFKRSRVPAVALAVETKNHSAVAFYRTFGFQRVRTLRDYYGRGRDGWRMRLVMGRKF